MKLFATTYLRSKLLLIFWVLTLGMGLFSPIQAQDQEEGISLREFDTSHIEKYRQDSDFQYEWEPGPKRPKGKGWAQTLKIIMYVFLGLILGGLALFVIWNSTGRSSKKIEKEAIPDLEEIDIRKVDLQTLLQQSIDQGDYRTGIRLLYLQLLKRLTKIGWIDWKPNKTNLVYEQEMAKRPSAEEFIRLTMSYEYIWYGNVLIEADLFEALHKRFPILPPATPPPIMKADRQTIIVFIVVGTLLLAAILYGFFWSQTDQLARDLRVDQKAPL